jgi:protein-L-isoaspartate(D-aspartate) O-methyltransferase
LKASNYKGLREGMIKKIKDVYGLDAPKVFAAMRKVPREEFVTRKDIAYQDCPVPIGHGQTMSQPFTVAFMTNLLNLEDKERVLEIGTGSGYQAAVLSHLAKEVYTIEIIDDLAEEARKQLERLGYKNVRVKSGQGSEGWEEKAPFDAIMITAGVKRKVPKTLLDQLKEGGVLVAPVGFGSDKEMTKFIKKEDGKFKQEKHGIFHFVPFVEK